MDVLLLVDIPAYLLRAVYLFWVERSFLPKTDKDHIDDSEKQNQIAKLSTQPLAQAGQLQFKRSRGYLLTNINSIIATNRCAIPRNPSTSLAQTGNSFYISIWAVGRTC